MLIHGMCAFELQDNYIVVLPARWRERFGGAPIRFGAGDHCVRLSLAVPGDPSPNVTIPDSNGCPVVPEQLRARLRLGSIVGIGHGDHVELWNHADYEAAAHEAMESARMSLIPNGSRVSERRRR